MRILVTGANGQLGMSLRRVLPQGTVYTDITSGSDTVPLDITDENDIRSKVEQYDIDTIVNCAAYTNVEAAEDNFMQAEFLNSFAVGNLARVMKERNGLLVHISTDYVFGGETYNTPCDENRKGTPTGVYGRTKLRGELSILESGVRHIIIRTAWLYSEFGKNFVKTMMKLTATLPQVQVVYDQAEAIGVILSSFADAQDSSLCGIYNYTDDGVCSWYDFAKFIALYSGNKGCDIRPCLSAEFPSKVKRPAYSVLDKHKIKETFGLSIPYWTDSLERCIRKIQNR